jgi:hypothetical protein
VLAFVFGRFTSGRFVAKRFVTRRFVAGASFLDPWFLGVSWAFSRAILFLNSCSWYFVLVPTIKQYGRYAADSGLYWLRVASCWTTGKCLKVFRAGVRGSGLCG